MAVDKKKFIFTRAIAFISLFALTLGFFLLFFFAYYDRAALAALGDVSSLLGSFIVILGAQIAAYQGISNYWEGRARLEDKLDPPGEEEG